MVTTERMQGMPGDGVTNELTLTPVDGGTLMSLVITYPDAEFRDMRLRFDLSFAEGTALRLVDILGLCHASTQLNRNIAIGFLIANTDHLTALKAEHGDGNMATIVLKQAGHPHLLRDHASTHDQFSSLQRPTETHSPRACSTPM